MPAIPKITIYTNDGTEILGSISLSEIAHGGYTVHVNDSGISPSTSVSVGYIYDGPGKWLGISMTPNATSPEYGPGTQVIISSGSKVYAVIGANKQLINIDLSTLSGYQALANGTYSLRVKAKATGYTDSDMSASVSWQKQEFTEVIPTLTNPYAVNIYDTDALAPFCHISNMDTSKIYTIHFENDNNITGFLEYENRWYYTQVNSHNTILVHNQSQDFVDLASGSGYTQSLLSIAALCGNKEAAINNFTGVQHYPVLPAYACIIEGTLITLANHTKKPIEDITYDDNLLVWNFYEGKFDSAKPIWITKPRLAHEYNLCKFSNSVEVGFVGNGGNEGYHRIYNNEAKAFTHTGVAETPIGTHTFAENGSFPELISQEVIKTPIRYYNIGTKEHINLFANGILTSSRISNKYAIENMKYIGDRLINEKDEQDYIKRKLELC